MAVQYSVALRNGMADAIETAIGASPKLQIRSGAQPANCAAADAGALLAEFPLVADWSPAATGGVKTLAAIAAVTAAASGVAGHYRVKDTAGTTCHAQGKVGLASDTPAPDLVIDNPTLVAGQQVSVSGWSITAPGS